MFSWFDALGLSDTIELLRINYGETSIYDWVKFNLPAALWLFAYLYVMDSVWSEYKGRFVFYAFLGIIPIAAIASEFMQYFSLLPGTFDIYDVLSYVAAIILYLAINKFKI